ncbi:Hypothetical predicted protein [Paramuricea clavata]|uniref:BRCT domain-containing protein n=1 Tax=Paramuricea clavata TaxID=317549 RepID=A0A6S7H5K0_PARCT|nr:Hypothetical predicted protein [Paramuricea clavata]
MDVNTSDLLDPDDSLSPLNDSLATSDLFKFNEENTSYTVEYVDASSSCRTSDLNDEIGSSPFSSSPFSIVKTSTPKGCQSFQALTWTTSEGQEDNSHSDDDLGCWPMECTSSEDEQEDDNSQVMPLPLDNGSSAMMDRLQQTPLEGTIFFLNLPGKDKNAITNIERIVCRKGALISDFLHKKVTHIIIESVDRNKPEKTTGIRKFYSPSIRSKLILQNSLKQAGEMRNSLNCLEQAKKFGIKIVYLSELLNPNFDWCKDVNMKTKYVRTWIDALQ